jgi:hypothetical protein
MKAFKDGNKLYLERLPWRAAKYEEAVAEIRTASSTPVASPDASTSTWATPTTTCIAPPRKGEPTNDSYLDKASRHYKMAAEKITDNDA